MVTVEEVDADVSETLLEEVMQYRTAQTVSQWPVVTNTATALLDGYNTVKKEGDVARVVLNASEDLASVLCQYLVLPVVQTAVVRTPLGLVDSVANFGACAVQKAIPKITDTEKPMQPDLALLVSILLLPLSLSAALGRDLTQYICDALVNAFPELQGAAEDFEERSLVGQCLRLALMVWVLLPLHLLSDPIESVRRVVSVLSKLALWALDWIQERWEQVSEWCGGIADTARQYIGSGVAWGRQTAAQVLGWAREYLVTATGVVVASVETAYYALFVVTGLEPMVQRTLAWLAGLVQPARDRLAGFLHQKQQGARRLVSTASESAPVRGLADIFANSELIIVKYMRELWCGSEEPEGFRPCAGRAASSS